MTKVMSKKMKPMSEMRTGNIAPIGGKLDGVHDPDRMPEPHEVDSAIEDMQRAEMHKANPHMMSAVKEAAGKKMMSLKSLKNLASKKAMEGK